MPISPIANTFNFMVQSTTALWDTVNSANDEVLEGNTVPTISDLVASWGNYVANSNFAESYREVQAKRAAYATLDYYVRTDGSDSNDGLSDTAGGAFLTLQNAVSVAGGLDYGSYPPERTYVTINLAPGTYDGDVCLPQLVGGNYYDWTNIGLVTIYGDLNTPSNVVIDGELDVNGGNGWCMGGCTVTGGGDGNIAIWLTERATFRGSSIVIGNGGRFLLYDKAQFFGYNLTFVNNGSFTRAIEMKHNSFFYHTNHAALTASGSGAYTDAFLHMESGSLFVSEGAVNVGSVTGPTYNCKDGCIITTANALPGNSFGTVTKGTVLNGNAYFGNVSATVPVLVGSLPSASSAGTGVRGFVTDATATTFNSIVAGGGGNKVPVVSDGTNWLIG